MKISKKILSILAFVLAFCWMFSFVNAQIAPEFDTFAKNMTEWQADKDGIADNVYDISAVDGDKTLEENIRCLFYPNDPYYNGNCNTNVKWWLIWSVFRYIWFWIFVLFLCVVGVKFIIEPDKAKDHGMSLVYILYGAVLFFWATWILGSALDVQHLTGTTSLVNAVQWSDTSIWFKIVAFLKTLVFFLAILMIIIYAFKAMSCADNAEKAKTAIKWIINVIVALVIIKVIDYLYFIAQSTDFVNHATSFILEVAKILWFIVWSLLVLMAFYAGFLFITDQWKWENMKKATKIIIWIVLVSSVIFLLLLIVYQLFMDFA